MRLCDLKIEDVAFGGKGVAREHGKAIFVPYTIEDEIVSAEIVREKKQFAEAELVEVKQSSPNRVTPQCPYFGGHDLALNGVRNKNGFAMFATDTFSAKRDVLNLQITGAHVINTLL